MPPRNWHKSYTGYNMTESFFTIQFRHNDLDYHGRVSPEKLGEDGHIISCHVVLNDIFFGYLSRTGKQWTCSEWRPQDLIDIVGHLITRHEKEPADNKADN